MAGIIISIAICYITFKMRIRFMEHMKKGANLQAPVPASVEGGFVMEFMLLLDGISVGVTKRGFTPVMCDKAFNS